MLPSPDNSHEYQPSSTYTQGKERKGETKKEREIAKFEGQKRKDGT